MCEITTCLNKLQNLVQIISHCSVKLHAVRIMIFFQPHLILSNRFIYFTMHLFCMDVHNDNLSNLLFLASEGRNLSAIRFIYLFGVFFFCCDILARDYYSSLSFVFKFVATAVVGGVGLIIF